jgi:hypothetical protein
VIPAADTRRMMVEGIEYAWGTRPRVTSAGT